MIAGQSRTPFFARAYSTDTRKVSLTSEFIGRQKRFVAFDKRWRTVSPLLAVRGRTRVLARIEARGRTNYVASSRPAISGSLLDTRFARAKSPRSRQYVLRRPAALLQAVSATNFARLREFRTARLRHVDPLTVDQVTRSTRRAVYLSPRQLTSSLQSTPTGVARFQNSLRREFVRLRAQQLAGPVPATKTTGILCPRLVVNAAPAVNQLRNLRQRLAHFSAQRRYDVPRPFMVGRPLLREHAASMRSMQINYRTPTVLQCGAIAVRPRLARLQRKWAKLFRKNATGFLNEAQRLPVSRRPVLLSCRSSGVRFSRNSAGFVLTANHRRIRSTPRKPSIRHSVHFRNISRKQGAYNLHFTARCVRAIRARRQTPFESYRPRL